MSQQPRLNIDRRTFVKLASGAAVLPTLPETVSAAHQSDTAQMEKLRRLDSYLNENNLEAVWFADSDSYAWLTGYSNVIDRSSPTGVAAVGYDGDDITIVVDNDEKALVRKEKFQDERSTIRCDNDTAEVRRRAGLPNVSIATFKWYRKSLANAVAENSPTPAAADFDVPGFKNVSAAPLRQPLTENDIERYRSIGEETAAAVEAVCRALRPEDTEQEVATALGGALDAYNLNHPVVLVAGEGRAQKYRHPVPTDAELGGYVLISVVGHRLGLYASSTRTVAFDPPEWLKERHNVAMRVDATALAATQAAIGMNETAADVFDVIQATYEEAGYPAEWKQHHQGGAAGYASREWVATPTSDAEITAPMAYAWNPTVQGTKSEGTVLVTKEGYEPFTLTGNWPTQTVKSYKHTDTVTRPDILYRTKYS
jgi:Xaa-Pro aminopeptidase